MSPNKVPKSFWNFHSFEILKFLKKVTGMRTSTQSYLVLTESLFGILSSRESDSSRVMRLLAEEYMASG
jgi:hypothetical protein